MNETQSLVTLVPWTVIAQILNLFIQMYLIKRFLFKPIKEVLKKRQEKADADIREAKEAREAAEAMKAEYEEGIAGARAEAAEIVQTAKKEAEVRSDQLIAEAEKKAAQIKEKAEADIAQERKKAINEVKSEIGGIAMEIAGKVVEREISEEDHRKLIDEFIQNVGEAS